MLTQVQQIGKCPGLDGDLTTVSILVELKIVMERGQIRWQIPASENISLKANGGPACATMTI